MAKKSFSDIFSKYKHYDPDKEGYGSVDQWSSAFDTRMGMEEATRRVGKDDPLFVLGLTSLPGTLEALRSVFRKLMLKNQEAHRQNASVEAQEVVKRIIAAYTVLVERIRLKG